MRRDPLAKSEADGKDKDMENVLARIAENLVDRMSGPLHFRIFLQPFMAVVFAVLDGRKDAHEGRAPYFWALFTDPGHRVELLRTG